MGSDSFELADRDGLRYWFVLDDNSLLFCCGSADSTDHVVLSRLDRDKLRDLIFWIGDDERMVTVMEGPMARETRKAAKEIGISEQMFVCNAVKIFLDVGSETE